MQVGRPCDEIRKLKLRIAELEAALRRAQRRFELLAVVSDEEVNGVRPSVGAAECAESLADLRAKRECTTPLGVQPDGSLLCPTCGHHVKK